MKIILTQRAFLTCMTHRVKETVLQYNAQKHQNYKYRGIFINDLSIEVCDLTIYLEHIVDISGLNKWSWNSVR